MAAPMPMTRGLWSSIQDLTSPPTVEPWHWPCCERLLADVGRGGGEKRSHVLAVSAAAALGAVEEVLL